MAAVYFFICRCTFLLLFLAFILGDKRCKTTKDCKNPGLDEFCDQILLACEPCSGYCTGAIDALSLCMKYCPNKYWMMFGGDYSPTPAATAVEQQTNSTQKKQGGSEETTQDPSHDQEQGHDSRHKKGSNFYVYIVVGVICAIVVVVVVVVVAIWLSYRCRQPKGSISLKDDENPEEIKERETTNVGEQADAEPHNAFSECVPSGLKDANDDKTVFYPEYPTPILTETSAEELTSNTKNPEPAKLQSMSLEKEHLTETSADEWKPNTANPKPAKLPSNAWQSLEKEHLTRLNAFYAALKANTVDA